MGIAVDCSYVWRVEMLAMGTVYSLYFMYIMGAACVRHYETHVLFMVKICNGSMLKRVDHVI